MANNVIQRPQNAIVQQSSLLDNYAEAADDLGAGIAVSFPVLSIKGKVWRIKFRGEEYPWLDDRGYPRPDVDVVIVKAPKHKSKVFYDGGYVEGEGRTPNCWASDGKVPDADVDAPQASSCAVCPQNVIGSRMTDQGKKTKACGDHKRVIVVPAGDVANEAFGGPMLLRVPATSLKTLQAYGDYLKRNQALYFGCVTTMTFDPAFAHQVINFDYSRALTDDEVRVILEHQKSDQVARILNEEIAATDPSLAEATVDEPEEEATPESNPSTGSGQPDTKPRVQPVQSKPVDTPTSTQLRTPLSQAPPNNADFRNNPPPRPTQPVPPRPATPVPTTPAKPVQQAPKPPVGAFTAKPTSPPLRQTQDQPITRPNSTAPAGTINRAVAQPAKAPVSTRPVVVAQEELPSEETGSVPDELDAQFGELMNKA
jgi:hypothetical protein